MICSFIGHSDRCADTMSTASPQETTTVTNTPVYMDVSTIIDAVTQTTLNQGGQGSPHPSEGKGLPNMKESSVAVPLVATFGSLLVFAGFAAYVYFYPWSRRRCSYSRRTSDTEAGRHNDHELEERGSAGK